MKNILLLKNLIHLTTENVVARLAQAKLAAKADIDNKLKDLNKEVTSNNTKLKNLNKKVTSNNTDM